jgi:hypothetical protein
MAMNRVDVESRLAAAVDAVVEQDRYLLEADVSERAIVHRLAHYLTDLFTTLDVDCEYNREGLLPKTVEWETLARLARESEILNPAGDPDSALVVPDVVVHSRGSNGRNLLVIEVKKSRALSGARGARLAEFDRQKLRAYRDLDGLRYRFSAFVVFPVSSDLGCEGPDRRITPVART